MKHTEACHYKIEPHISKPVVSVSPWHGFATTALAMCILPACGAIIRVQDGRRIQDGANPTNVSATVALPAPHSPARISMRADITSGNPILLTSCIFLANCIVLAFGAGDGFGAGSLTIGSKPCQLTGVAGTGFGKKIW